MVVSVPRDTHKHSLKDTFLEIKKFRKKEHLSFCKFYNNEGTSQLLLQSDHFINPTVWLLVFGVSFMTRILVMIFCHKDI